MNPRIRFKGENASEFPDWNCSQIESILTYERPDRYIVKTKIKSEGKVPVLTANKSFILGYTDEDDGIYKRGDVIIFDDFTCDCKLVNFSFKVKSSAIKLLTTDEKQYSLKFVFEAIKRLNIQPKGHQRHWISFVQKQKLFIPSLEEQQKIASFFSTLDQKIELNERKLEALEKLKKGLLRKIFDHEIRFKSDDGGTYSNWNESSLGNYFSVKMCKRIFKEETSDIGEVPFFKIGTFGKTPDAYISKELFEKYRKNFNYPSINDTLISCSGTVGRCVLFDGKASYFQDSNIVWLEPIDKHLIYNKIYLYIVLSNLSWHELSSTTIKRIYSKDLLSKKWPIPCIEEQNKIASLFILLDKKITLFSQRLQSLKKLKKGFMQQMFV